MAAVPTTASSPATRGVGEGIDLDAPIDVQSFGVDLAASLYGRMVLIREFEQRVNQLFLAGPDPRHDPPVARAGGVCGRRVAPLRTDDWIMITHRGHGQAWPRV